MEGLARPPGAPGGRRGKAPGAAAGREGTERGSARLSLPAAGSAAAPCEAPAVNAWEPSPSRGAEADTRKEKGHLSGSLPVSIASAPEQEEQLPPRKRLPSGSGQRALAPPGSPALATLGSPGVPGVAAGAARSGPIRRSNSSLARRGKGRTCFSPGQGFLRDGEGASGGTAGLPCSAALARRGG
ncbi:translation initiation factor IF-2-like isoform X3 [Oenanthe melanoleuca]|uniref:translation initiation factor IF-2-like isoform X3 n=1 Tax=Oenanthe melanoleuca TaxID=2939378 RepID=UPI0024C18D71|nr:translation initiation factor IF-2-like isoform X3 [Oenanthe melanoleuca]